MKKLMAIILLIGAFGVVLSGCAKSEEGTGETGTTGEAKKETGG